jgi:hypothetical protein
VQLAQLTQKLGFCLFPTLPSAKRGLLTLENKLVKLTIAKGVILFEATLKIQSLKDLEN